VTRAGPESLFVITTHLSGTRIGFDRSRVLAQEILQLRLAVEERRPSTSG
jgi:hypothetical protein